MADIESLKGEFMNTWNKLPQNRIMSGKGLQYIPEVEGFLQEYYVICEAIKEPEVDRETLVEKLIDLNYRAEVFFHWNQVEPHCTDPNAKKLREELLGGNND